MGGTFIEMNLRDLEHYVKLGVQREDINSSYKMLVNQAIREITQAYSFSFMRQTDTVTIQAGASSARLPDDFKEFFVKDPIYLNHPRHGLCPVEVREKEEAYRWLNRLGYQASRSSSPRDWVDCVYVDWEDGLPSIHLVDTTTSTDLELQVNYYRIPRNLEKDTDENMLTRSYSMMVIDKAKFLAFKLINDPSYAEFEVAFQTAFNKAKANDAYRQAVGRSRRTM